MRTFATCLAAALLTACAGSGSERGPVPPPGPTLPASAAKPPVEPTGSATPASDIGTPATAKAKPGYSLKQRNGVAVYCRREVPTGSRRPVENCYTPEQLEQIEAATDEARNSLSRQRNSSGCGKFCSAGS
jgi:hypothetical protein